MKTKMLTYIDYFPLRKGNFITSGCALDYSDGEPEPDSYIITEIDYSVGMFKAKGIDVSCELTVSGKPFRIWPGFIPISKEWMIKLGLKLNNEGHPELLKDISYSIRISDNKKVCNNKYGIELPIQINYVHELQNLIAELS